MSDDMNDAVDGPRSAADLLPVGDAVTDDVAGDDASVDGVGDDGGVDVAESDTATDDTSIDSADAPEVVPADDPWTRPGQWYVVHTQSGHEKKVTLNLEARIASMNLEHKVFEVVAPTEEVVEYRNGKKQTVNRKVFPGYLLVQIGRASCRERV